MCHERFLNRKELVNICKLELLLLTVCLTGLFSRAHSRLSMVPKGLVLWGLLALRFFLQVGCSVCHQTDSVKTLKEESHSSC